MRGIPGPVFIITTKEQRFAQNQGLSQGMGGDEQIRSSSVLSFQVIFFSTTPPPLLPRVLGGQFFFDLLVKVKKKFTSRSKMGRKKPGAWIPFRHWHQNGVPHPVTQAEGPLQGRQQAPARLLFKVDDPSPPRGGGGEWVSPAAPSPGVL